MVWAVAIWAVIIAVGALLLVAAAWYDARRDRRARRDGPAGPVPPDPSGPGRPPVPPPDV